MPQRIGRPHADGGCDLIDAVPAFNEQAFGLLDPLGNESHSPGGEPVASVKRRYERA